MLLLTTGFSIAACNDQPASETTEEKTKEVKIKEENISYAADNTTSNSFVAYDENSDKKRPAVNDQFSSS